MSLLKKCFGCGKNKLWFMVKRRYVKLPFINQRALSQVEICAKCAGGVQEAISNQPQDNEPRENDGSNIASGGGVSPTQEPKRNIADEDDGRELGSGSAQEREANTSAGS